jgi:hypothetical protein
MCRAGHFHEENHAMKCTIEWIDGNGNLTPDQNEAVGRVYVNKRFGNQTKPPELFPICAEHVKELAKPGMVHFTFVPLGADPKITSTI